MYGGCATQTIRARYGRNPRSQRHSKKLSRNCVRLRRLSAKAIYVPEQRRSGNYSFNDLATKYLTWIAGRQASAEVKAYIIERLRRATSYREQRQRAKSHDRLLLPLRSFNTYLIEQLQTELKKKGLRKPTADKEGKIKEAGPLKDTSTNRILSTLKHMFSKAVEWELVEEPILKKIRNVKLSQEVGRLRYIFAKEAAILVNVCDEHLKPIVTTALHTGMRRGEILNLKWEENVDLQHGFILLDKTKNGERREIPINRTLRETFNKVPRRFVEKEGKKELILYVFHDPGTLKPYGNIKHSFNSAVKRAGIRDFRFSRFTAYLRESRYDVRSDRHCYIVKVTWS